MSNIKPKKQHQIVKSKLSSVDISDNKIEYDLSLDGLNATILCQVKGDFKGTVSWRCSDSNCKIYVDRKYGGSPFRGTASTSLSEEDFASKVEEILISANEMLNNDFE